MSNSSYPHVSVLASLRGLTPARRVEPHEALQVAEIQAARLRRFTGVQSPTFPESAIAELPRVRVVRRRLPMSGMSYWDGHQWVLAINNREPETRQRFTLLHEYKHIIDHGKTSLLYPGNQRTSAETQAENAADYFAGCVLMPKQHVKRLWGEGHQTLRDLAEQFGVSERAVEVRLAQLGLTEPQPRCHGPNTKSWRPGRYYRTPRLHWEAA